MTRSAPPSEHDTDDERTIAASMGQNVCALCGKAALFMCSPCGLGGPRYCSENCQKQHWKLGHAKACEATKALRRSRHTAEHNSSPPDPVEPHQDRPIAMQELNRQTQSVSADDDDDESDAQEAYADIVFYTQQIYRVIQPVVACILLSIFWVKVAHSGKSDYVMTTGSLLFSPALGAPEASGSSSISLSSAANAGIIIGEIVIMTFVIVFCFKKGLFKLMVGFFGIVITLLLGFVSYQLLLNLLQVFAIPMDFITMAFALWNFVVVGLVSVFWRGPLWLQQSYMTVMSSLMAFSLANLEEWTVWILLGLLVVWDLIAVLCPFGPLRMLIESSRSQQREVPALLYTVNAVWLMMATTEQLHPSTSSTTSPLVQDPLNGRRRTITQTSLASLTTNDTDYQVSSSSTALVPSVASPTQPTHMLGDSTTRSSTVAPYPVTMGTPESQAERADHGTDNRRETEQDDEEDAEKSGLKLGLGDFVFYSLLVARASLYDWITTVCCTIAVLTGLTVTIFLLAIYKKALPALPISIAFGILFYFTAKTVLVPYVAELCMIGMVGL